MPQFSDSIFDEEPVELEWSLVGKPDGLVSQTIRMQSFPFQVGRREGLNLTLRRASVSKFHAEFVIEDGALSLRDLNSTNGTFVNGVRIDGQVPVEDKDMIQFERLEFQVRKRVRDEANKTLHHDGRIATFFELRQLICQRAVVPHFQPIVRIDDGKIMGYEVLVRSSKDGLKNAAELFDLAERAGLEFELSDLARSEGVRQGAALGKQTVLFLNTHPAELSRIELIASLNRLRRNHPQAELVLEIHEGSVCDQEVLRNLSHVLRDLDIDLAYDDFGIGQSRLIELIDLPPKYLKFDLQLIRGIDKASDSRRRSVESLVRMALDLGSSPLAEGVESLGEVLACADLGFELAQGYFCGKPITAQKALSKQVQEDFGFEEHSTAQSSEILDAMQTANLLDPMYA